MTLRRRRARQMSGSMVKRLRVHRPAVQRHSLMERDHCTSAVALEASYGIDGTHLQRSMDEMCDEVVALDALADKPHGLRRFLSRH
jgi:hypothetical protein